MDSTLVVMLIVAALLASFILGMALLARPSKKSNSYPSPSASSDYYTCTPIFNTDADGSHSSSSCD